VLKISYSAEFIRQFKKLEPATQAMALNAIELFKNKENHQALRVHKLHGRYTGSYSFSVGYKIRIAFDYVGKNPKTALLLTIGGHDIYK
jgi:mRNA-degrading endonuclease YafQ of YafQ-DinJ toxin-antitoxin module